MFSHYIEGFTPAFCAGAHLIALDVFKRIQGLRRQGYGSCDYAGGIRSFLEKRKPMFKGE
jgi:hypothetical protein